MFLRDPTVEKFENILRTSRMEDQTREEGRKEGRKEGKKERKKERAKRAPLATPHFIIFGRVGRLFFCLVLFHSIMCAVASFNEGRVA